MLKILKLAFILGIFCIVSAGSLAYVYQFAQPKIEKNAQLAYEVSLKEVTPEGGEGVKVSPQGYAAPIKMLVGVKEGKVTGVKILEHKETPGLGAKIVIPSFLKQFVGKTKKDPLEPKQGVDAITGATISSKAVCSGVWEALGKK